MNDVVVPQWGLTMDDAVLTVWLKHVGERILEGEAIAEIETDKVTSELEVTHSGTIAELCVTEGTNVVPGQVIARLSED